jgi:hypothetical protein
MTLFLRLHDGKTKTCVTVRVHRALSRTLSEAGHPPRGPRRCTGRRVAHDNADVQQEAYRIRGMIFESPAF